MQTASVSRKLAALEGDHAHFESPALDALIPANLASATPPPFLPMRRRRGIIAAGLAAILLSACAQDNEPPKGCLLAAINERAVLRARNYMQPNVEAHLLAIWFEQARHVALVVKGDHRWFAWDDAYGGRPLFLGNSARLPDAMTAASAAFPRNKVEMAWWADELAGPDAPVGNNRPRPN